MLDALFASAFASGLLLLSSFIPFTLAASRASPSDFYLALIGQPLLHPAPRFHYASAHDAHRLKAPALIYVATERNVLAAIQPKDGATGELEEVLCYVRAKADGR